VCTCMQPRACLLVLCIAQMSCDHRPLCRVEPGPPCPTHTHGLHALPAVSLRRGFTRDQARIEQSYNELSSSLSDTSHGAPAGGMPSLSSYAGGSGHLVPVPTDWKDPALLPFTIMPAVASVGYAIRGVYACVPVRAHRVSAPGAGQCVRSGLGAARAAWHVTE